MHPTIPDDKHYNNVVTEYFELHIYSKHLKSYVMQSEAHRKSIKTTSYARTTTEKYVCS